MKKLNIIFWSGSGNTEAMANLIAEGAKENGLEVKLLNVSDASTLDVEGCDVLALGSPAMGCETIEEGEMYLENQLYYSVHMTGELVNGWILGKIEWKATVQM